MMEEDNSRKVFLSVLGVAILIVAVVGITYAAYTFTNNNAGDNTITTGTITMSYTEPSAGINLVNALPMSDSDARTTLGDSGEVFSFTVATTASGTVTVPYEINIEKVNTSTLPDSSVKIELTTGNVGAGEVVSVAPQLMSALRAAENNSTIRTGTHTLKDVSVNFVDGDATNKTVTYNLRIWVDQNVDTNSDVAFPASGTYSIKVHVDSHVNPIA